MMQQQHLLLRVASLALGSLLLGACYDYVPVQTAPPTGEHVTLSISDRGRVALGSRFGAGLTEIEGRYVGLQDSDFVIDVLRVSQIDGGSSLWSGEQARLSRDYVGTVKARQLSKVRTVALAVGVAAAAGLLASRSLKGSLSESNQTGEPTPPISVRIPISLHF